MLLASMHDLLHICVLLAVMMVAMFLEKQASSYIKNQQTMSWNYIFSFNLYDHKHRGLFKSPEDPFYSQHTLSFPLPQTLKKAWRSKKGQVEEKKAQIPIKYILVFTVLLQGLMTHTCKFNTYLYIFETLEITQYIPSNSESVFQLHYKGMLHGTDMCWLPDLVDPSEWQRLKCHEKWYLTRVSFFIQ